MTMTIAAKIAAQAYGQVRGLHLSMSNLIVLVKGETPTFHELLDLGCGIYASKDDVLAGLESLRLEHSGIATMREVLEDEFGVPAVPLLLADEDDVDDEEEELEDDDDDWEDDDLDDDEFEEDDDEEDE